MHHEPENRNLFIQELGYLIDELEECIRLDSKGVQVYYRLFHSIKTMAALGGMQGLEKAAHEQETQLAKTGINRVQIKSFGAFARHSVESRIPAILETLPASDPEVLPGAGQKSANQFYRLDFGTWPMDGNRLERLWTQISRHRDVFCLSVWINCEAREARVRCRLLQAKLENSFWVMDTRAWAPDGDRGFGILDTGEDAPAWEAAPVFFQAILLPTNGSRASIQETMPDQVDFWSVSVMEADFFTLAGRTDLSGERVALLARKMAEPHQQENLQERATHVAGLIREACLGLAGPRDLLGSMISRALDSLFQPKADRIRLFLSLDQVSLPPRCRSVFLEVLLQLGRNILAHGVEPARTRQDQYKDPRMSVHVHLQRNQDGLSLLIWDDGPGLSLDELERATPDHGEGAKGTYPGLPGHVGEIWGKDVFPLLEAGLEAHEEAGLAAGRGVGLASAAFIVRNILQGEIYCHSRPGSGTCFHIRMSRLMMQSRCSLFRWRDEVIAIPRSSIMEGPSGPVLIPCQGKPDKLEWAGRTCHMANPLPVLELESLSALAILDSRGRTGRWVGTWLGDEDLVFAWDANAAWSSLVSAWVELGDF